MTLPMVRRLNARTGRSPATRSIRNAAAVLALVLTVSDGVAMPRGLRRPSIVHHAAQGVQPGSACRPTPGAPQLSYHGGDLVAHAAVFVLFAITAKVNWTGDFGVWSSWLDTAAYDGIVAVPVALLMIGGEFDLSAGVMIGSSGLLLGILTTKYHWNIWPAILVCLLFGLAIGFLNGYTVVKTKLPSFIVTLGTFFMLRGINAGLTIKITGGVSINDIDQASGFSFAHKVFASTVWEKYGLSVATLWWLGLTVVAAGMLLVFCVSVNWQSADPTMQAGTRRVSRLPAIRRRH